MAYLTFLCTLGSLLAFCFNGVSGQVSPSPGYGSSAYSSVPSQNANPRPNIFFFVADDLGRSDVSFTQGNLQTPTPHIDKIAWDGIILNRNYVNPSCSPTRGALVTGKYTFHTGTQAYPITELAPWGLPLNFTIMPQYFKKLGYTSYHIGKWHLGASKRAFYPLNRGFDDSFGVSGGDCNSFNYTAAWIMPVPYEGNVFRINGKSVPNNHTSNNYAPDLWTSRAEQIIRNADPSQPWIIHFWTTAVHTAPEHYGPVIQTMPQFRLRPPVFSFSDQFPQRKKLLATVQNLDDSFRRITEALVNKGIINNTILVFFSDNGPAISQYATFTRGANYGSSYPLRGGKGVLFEGGVRTPAFIWSLLLNKRGRITNQLFHVTDWLPTLYEAVGGNVSDLASQNLDGVSHWRSFQSGLNYGPRTELVNNIDNVNNQFAMITQDQNGGLYKIIGGNVFNNVFIGWSETEGTTAKNTMRTWTPVTINCNFPEGDEVSTCIPSKADCLFDLINDPCELNNIASSYPSMLKLLQNKISVYNSTSFPDAIQPESPAGLPDKWNGIFVPWLDPDEIFDKLPLTYAPFSPSSSF